MLMSTAVALGAGAGLVGGLANTGMQFANLNYQKGIQQDIFDREDNSIQRRVRDLRKAGLSPVLAAGQGAGTGGVVSTQAPQLDGITDSAQIALNMMKMEADIDATRAQEEYTEYQKKVAEALLPGQIGQQFSAIKNMDAQAYKTWQDGRVSKVSADNKVGSGTTEDTFLSKWLRDYGGFKDAYKKHLENEQGKKATGVPKKKPIIKPRSGTQDFFNDFNE